jgi:hypothetical protein
MGAFLQRRPFAWSAEGRVDEAIRCRQLRPIVMRRTSETGAFLSAEDADSPRTLFGPCGAFTESCRPLTFRCHLQAHPSRNPCSPDVLSSITLLADGEGELTCKPEDPASPCR